VLWPTKPTQLAGLTQRQPALIPRCSSQQQHFATFHRIRPLGRMFAFMLASGLSGIFGSATKTK